MIDPRCEAILIRPKEADGYQDRTNEIARYQRSGLDVLITFAGRGGKSYPYSAARVLILDRATPLQLAPDDLVEVKGQVRHDAFEVVSLSNAEVHRIRVFYRHGEREWFEIHETHDVRVIANASRDPRVSASMAYFRLVAENLAPDNPTRKVFDALTFIHPDSALARILAADPIAATEADGSRPPLFPFSSNISQRQAVQNALTYPISVIDGPPGTGKTQTILNLIASLVAEPGASVGVVSFNNAAVENVGDKLKEVGIDYISAALGRYENREKFLNGQGRRNSDVVRMLESPAVEAPSSDEIAKLASRLDHLQSDQIRLAGVRQDLEAHRLQREHLRRAVDPVEIDRAGDLPLARRSSQRILDFLVETQIQAEPTGWLARWFNDVRRYARYGSLRGVDLEATTTALAAQIAYYDRRISELSDEAARLERTLDRANLEALVAEHRDASSKFLGAGLRHRYEQLDRVEYDKRYMRRFRSFADDYPVVLSTCHSLRKSIGEGNLLDYLVIDEASQVDLLSAAAALACCRNVVVVGDLQQLGHIPDEEAGSKAGQSPVSAFDYREHSVLSAVIELYGDKLPRTMLREHYRCAPQIIGFCNEKFYDGKLVPLTEPGSQARPLMLFRTAEGNHMRFHRGGGRSNQREIDVITEEIIPQHFADIAPTEIGVTSPFRLQAGKAQDALDDAFEADTVHRFQGRQKSIVIMSAVLDETWSGRKGTRFVDDPRLVNVAISRAVDAFALVTNHDMLPASRHLRDLMGYIAYQDMENDVEDSQVISVFDLLYKNYSERLNSLAGRLRRTTRYRSEDIGWTVLNDVLADPAYVGLEAVPQVLLINLFADLAGLSEEQAAYVRNRASVDFVVYNKVTKRPLLAIEVDGFAWHENNPIQRARDALKDRIFQHYDLSLLRLKTTGSGEEARIRARLDLLLNPD